MRGAPPSFAMIIESLVGRTVENVGSEAKVATGFWTVARPSVKLIIPTATVTAPAAAKNVILRITPFLNAPRVTFVRNWLTSGS